MFDIRYFWRAATVYAIMLRRKKRCLSSFFLLRGLRHPLLQNSCAAIGLLNSDAENASTREDRCSTFNDFFDSELAFVAFQTLVYFCLRFFVANGAARL